MIKLIYGYELAREAYLADQMFRLRAEVFKGRLNWEVKVSNGWEQDQFDRHNPLYALSIDTDGELQGALRLLPTTGPHMLRDVFNSLMDDDAPIVSPQIWESTRFCVSPKAAAIRSHNRLNYVTGELLASIVEVGQRAGLSSVISVYDARMRRILRLAGCEAVEVGTPRKIGNVTTYAGLFPIDTPMLERIRAAAGIEGSVLDVTPNANATLAA
ncbi:MAG: acyl-homoserine-lactone synthase [Pseudomonadota bacterium]